MTNSEPIPEYYHISKGNGKYIPEEHVVELETYMYEISKGDDGFMIAQCPELHAVTQGKTWAELKDNILEVHSLMLDYDRISS